MHAQMHFDQHNLIVQRYTLKTYLAANKIYFFACDIHRASLESAANNFLNLVVKYAPNNVVGQQRKAVAHTAAEYLAQ